MAVVFASLVVYPAGGRLHEVSFCRLLPRQCHDACCLLYHLKYKMRQRLTREALGTQIGSKDECD